MRSLVKGKPAALLTGRRVLVLEAAPGHATVEVTGAHATYTVTRRRGGWHCTCPAYGGCSHLTAARAVLEPPPTQVEEPHA